MTTSSTTTTQWDFPSFSEGLSLRLGVHEAARPDGHGFPFLFGGAFIEARIIDVQTGRKITFPFLFGGAFIEAGGIEQLNRVISSISLPFRRGFH